jgi:hypothetical protein
MSKKPKYKKLRKTEIKVLLLLFHSFSFADRSQNRQEKKHLKSRIQNDHDPTSLNRSDHITLQSSL